MRTTTITPSVFYFGTPVTLITTLMPDDETTNISPISSAWALGDMYALGMSRSGQGFRNLERTGRLVINLPDASLAGRVERLAPTTGAVSVPAHKRERFRYEADKWSLGGFTPVGGGVGEPARVVECPIQMEARVSKISSLDDEDTAVVVHAKVVRTHVHEGYVVEGTRHIDLDRWRPLYYMFRHYFAQGEEVGVNFRAEY